MQPVEQRPRVVFFGTPTFAVPSLRALTEMSDVRAVITQPDRPSGRGLEVKPTPVKVFAEEHRIPVLQPTKIRTEEFVRALASYEPAVSIVVAYGRILPSSVLTIPPHGCINVHASLLPRWRGAAPIQYAVVHGDKESGVSLMQLDEGMDTGPVFVTRATSIDENESAEELAVRLSEMGADLLRQHLKDILAGTLVAVAQDHSKATSASLMDKGAGRVDWNRTAREVHNLVRGMKPWPGAFSNAKGARIKLHRSLLLTDEIASAPTPPGTIIFSSSRGIDVACGKGIVRIVELQAEGKRRMNAGDFLAGHRLDCGIRFES